eukprot:gene28425-35231_t
MEKQWQTSAAPSTALPSTSARPGNFPDQEDFSMQPDEEDYMMEELRQWPICAGILVQDATHPLL